jgi:hypothetical protein
VQVKFNKLIEKLSNKKCIENNILYFNLFYWTEMPFKLHHFLIWGIKPLCVMGHVAEIMVLILSKLNTWPSGLYECMHHYCAMLANKG